VAKKAIFQEIAIIKDNRGLLVKEENQDKVQVNVINAMKLDILLGIAQVNEKTIKIKRDWYSLHSLIFYQLIYIDRKSQILHSLTLFFEKQERLDNRN
jgi:hypothetical protein